MDLSSLSNLPLDDRGYPVPWFVDPIQGRPDFRVIDLSKKRAALAQSLCFICGEPLGPFFAFILAPIAAVTRLAIDPPAHYECALYAAAICPFLTHTYALAPVPNGEDAKSAKPDVVLIWLTGYFRLTPIADGWLLRPGDPVALAWFAGGRRATRAEIIDAIDRAAPHLRRIAAAESREAAAAVEQKIADLIKQLPPD